MYSGGVSYQTPSTVTGPSGTAVTFDGSTGGIGAQQPTTGPSVYSEELWFKTTTGSGGKLIGFGDQQSGLSSNYDRHVYMLDAGQLVFGVWTGQANTITTANNYNDGTWHQVVATQGGDGMALYVDGAARRHQPADPGPALHRVLAGRRRQRPGAAAARTSPAPSTRCRCTPPS